MVSTVVGSWPVRVNVTEYESTPNPNALKCWLSGPLSSVPRSFLNPEMAGEDPLARLLFQQAGLTSLLINGDWMTINKPAEAVWSEVKREVERVLANGSWDESES